MDDIHSLVICQYCKKVFKSPVILSCSNTICKQHIDELLTEKNSNKINCFFCRIEHLVPENGFIPEKNVEKLIKHNLDKLNFGETHQKALILCQTLRKSLKKIESIQVSPNEFLEKYFSNLKNKINVRREILKTDIDSIANKMIDDLNVYEDECKSKITQPRLFKNDILDLSTKLDNWENTLSSFNIDAAKWSSIKTESELMNLKLSEQITKLERELLMHKSFKFETTQLERITSVNEIFGELKISGTVPLKYHSISEAEVNRNLQYNQVINGYNVRKKHEQDISILESTYQLRTKLKKENLSNSQTSIKFHQQKRGRALSESPYRPHRLKPIAKENLLFENLKKIE